VASIDVEFKTWKYEYATPVAGFPQQRIPVHSIVIRHGEYLDASIRVGTDYSLSAF
jgi:hypothetical protein